MGMTYDEYLKKVQGFATEARDKAKASAASILSEAKTDADTEYERSKSTYGMLAEQMAQSGLSGSGYSDNLTREAYAARQTGYDNAFKSYNEMMRSADQRYQEGMLAAEEAALAYKEGIDQNFENAYEGVAEGTGKAELNRLIKRFGFSKEQADYLYKKAKWDLLTDEEYRALFPTSGTSTEGEQPEGIIQTPGVWDSWDISTITNDPEKSKTTRNELHKLRLGGIENITKEAWDAMFDTVSGDPNSVLAWLSQEYTDGKGETITPTIADYLMNKGVISKGLRDKVYEWDSYEEPKGENAQPEKEAAPFTTKTLGAWRENLANLTKEEFDAAIKNIKENDDYGYNSALIDFLLETPNINGLTDTSGGTTIGEYLFGKGVLKADDDLYKKFLEKKNANPEPKPGGGGDPEFYATGLKVNNGLNTSGGSGDNFSVTDGDRKYRIQLGEKTEDGVILNKASELADGTIFMYDGNAYIKVKTDDGQEVWSVEGRPAWPGHYADFLDKAKENMSSNGTGDMSVSVGQDSKGNAVINIKGTRVQVKGVKADSDVMDYANKNGVRIGEFFYKGEDLYFLGGNGNVWKIYEGAEDFKEYYDLKKGTIPKDAFTPVTADLSGTLNILGNNFTATIDGVDYKIQTGERASAAVEDFVTKEGSNIPEKSLFIYDGKLYMRDKKKVYEVEDRYLDKHKGTYDKLLEAAKASAVQTPTTHRAKYSDLLKL